MKRIYKYWLLLCLGLACMPASAQNIESGYFVDGYLYRNSMNPAFDNEQDYISLFWGNIVGEMRGDLRVDDVIGTADGKTYLLGYTGKDASSFNKSNKTSADFKFQLPNAGFKAWGGYNTIGMNIRGNVSADISGDLLQIAQDGLQNKDYHIGSTKLHAQAYMEMTIGHSRKIGKKLRVGATAKLLVGLANVDANLKTADLSLQNNVWNITTDANIATSIHGFSYDTTSRMRGPKDNQTKHTYVNGGSINGYGMAGLGAALDLGVEYKIDKNWTISAAVLDLGIMRWNNRFIASTDSVKSFCSNEYLFSPEKEDEHYFKDEVKSLYEDACALYEMSPQGDEGAYFEKLSATTNIGINYTLPIYDKLKFGLVNTTRWNSDCNWTEFRLSANYAPNEWLSGGCNVSVGTYGTSFGWIFNIHPTSFNLFLAMDHVASSYCKQMVPMSGIGSLSFGLNIPF